MSFQKGEGRKKTRQNVGSNRGRLGQKDHDTRFANKAGYLH